jgi:hypothetical protein
VLLWTTACACCGQDLYGSRHAAATCDDFLHRLCTAINSVTAAGYGRLVSRTPPSDPGSDPIVEVIRSPRRRRTVSAHRSGDRIIVSVPARISRKEESRWVALLVARVLEGERKERPSDADLVERSAALSERYLGGRAVPTSVRWVDNMSVRWGSCTPVDGTIRLSRRLLGMPGFVIDYVLLHELAHLIEPGHGPVFWRELAGYERLERAQGFLEGVDSVQQR